MNEIQKIQSKIYEVRGQRVMLDSDLAVMYGVETRVLNQAVKRNIERFPEDFMFQLTKGEWTILKSQIVTLKSRRNQQKTTSMRAPACNSILLRWLWQNCNPGSRGRNQGAG